MRLSCSVLFLLTKSLKKIYFVSWNKAEKKSILDEKPENELNWNEISTAIDKIEIKINES